MEIIAMTFYSFLIAQIFISEIYSWMCYFYIIKRKTWAPAKPIYKLQEKKLPMDYDKVE